MTASLRIYQDVEDDNMSLILPLKIKFEKESTTPVLFFKLMQCYGVAMIMSFREADVSKKCSFF